MSIQLFTNDLTTFVLPSLTTTTVALLSLFAERAWGAVANPSTGICTFGQTAAFFTPECPDGWEPIDDFGTRYIKITNNSSLVGTFGGEQHPTLGEKNIPSHTHKLAGAPEGSGGGNLGYGPYPPSGEESYRLEGTTHSADTFDSAPYGEQSPAPIPEQPFVYARLCNCTSDGQKTIKDLIDRVDNLDDSKGSKSISIAGLVTGLIGTVFAVGHGLNWAAQKIRGRSSDESAQLLDDPIDAHEH